MILDSGGDELLVFRREPLVIQFNRTENKKLPFRNGEGKKLLEDLGKVHGRMIPTT